MVDQHFEHVALSASKFLFLLVVLQQIPHVSPTGQYTTGIPLLMILCVSAVKEIFEDVVSTSLLQ